MRVLWIAVVALSLAACASTKKTETAEAAVAPAAKTTEAPAKTTKLAKKAKTSSEAATGPTTSSSDDTSASGGSSAGLPSIQGTEKSSVTCTNKADTRKISVLTRAEGGCGVVYNKMGEEKTVAMAKSENYCESVSAKIKTNLEGAGFNCGGSGSSSDQPAQ